jgi:hypothetical protein
MLELSQKAAQLYLKKTPEQKRLILSRLFEKLAVSAGYVSVSYTNLTRATAKNIEESYILLGGTK